MNLFSKNNYLKGIIRENKVIDTTYPLNMTFTCLKRKGSD
jgi:hypothetical protein